MNSKVIEGDMKKIDSKKEQRNYKIHNAQGLNFDENINDVQL